jgi:hypothetical protein
MASTTYHTIAIRGAAARDEGVAEPNSDIKPGHLLVFNSTGNLEVHATEEGAARPVLVALESPTAPAGTTAAIDALYTASETVYYTVGQPGDVLYMILAASQTAVKGTSKLVSKGDGTLKVQAFGTALAEGGLVGVPYESKTTTGAAARILVRIA